MIVIGTHNGWDWIHQSVDKAVEYSKGKYPITVVDADSSNPLFSIVLKEYIEDLGINYIHTTNGYELGSLRSAIEAFPDEPWYFFQQDSVQAKDPNVYDEIVKRLENADIVNWILFPKDFCAWTYPVEREMAIKWTGSEEYEYGIYGSQFAAKNETIKYIWDDLRKMDIKDKYGSRASERALAILFKLKGLKVEALEEIFLTTWQTHQQDGYKYFTKLNPTGSNKTRS